MQSTKSYIKGVIIFAIIIFCMQLTTYYLMQSKTEEIQDYALAKINQIYLSEGVLEQKINTILDGNDDLLGQLQYAQNQLSGHEIIIAEYNQRISLIEDQIIAMQQSIDKANQEYADLIKKYEELKRLYSQTDGTESDSTYYGRLYIPDAGISVAVYRGWAQSIVDREDSAGIFAWRGDPGYSIADHNNQAFATLYKVKVGTTGYFILSDGRVLNIKCVDTFNGHNTGKYIVDENGVNAANRADFMMYTCIDHWTNIYICLWEIV